MKTRFRLWAAAVLGTAAAVAVSSCAYDPYYSSVGASYSSGYGGYGYGHGYGGSSFSTSIFVSTGNPRWGYDPYCHSYYDYTRRAYYDPYLYGYYPVGYRPPIIVGVPHPHGWRPGRGRVAPPSVIRDRRLSNYSNRESAYRNSNYSWARQVRQDRSPGRPEGSDRSPGRPGIFDRGNDRRPETDRNRGDRRDFFGSPGRVPDRTGENPGRAWGNEGRPSRTQPPQFINREAPADRSNRGDRGSWQGQRERQAPAAPSIPSPSPRVRGDGGERFSRGTPSPAVRGEAPSRGEGSGRGSASDRGGRPERSGGWQGNRGRD